VASIHGRGESATGAVGLGPSRWLMVVVDFSSVPARVVTAYGKDPPGWTP